VPYIAEHQLTVDGPEFTLAPKGVPETFCADIPAADAAWAAVSQRPLAGVALSEAAPTPAWRSRPTWAVFGMISHPKEVADVVLTAVRSTTVSAG
jgi:hypothetical protein